jgi:dTDP-4-dehydrorhamnose reductase
MQNVQYLSTCYVSGRYAGPFSEDDLEVGAPFNNFYEETKHLAEADVRADRRGVARHDLPPINRRR